MRLDDLTFELVMKRNKSFDEYAKRRMLQEGGIPLDGEAYSRLKKAKVATHTYANGVSIVIFKGDLPGLGSDGTNYSVTFDYEGKMLPVNDIMERNYRSEKEVQQLLYLGEGITIAENPESGEKEGFSHGK